MPDRLTWPKHQERIQKTNENELLKYFPAQKLTAQEQNEYQKPRIEKINWRKYSLLRNIRNLNKSPLHSAAFSPTIRVMDGNNQIITSRQGVGLVVNNKNRYKDISRWIINNMMEDQEVHKENYEPQQSMHYRLHPHRRKLFRIQNSTPSPSQRLRTWTPNLVREPNKVY